MRDGTAPVRRLVDARRSGAARGREDVEVPRQHGLRADRARNDDAAGAAALSPGQPLPPPVRSRRGEAGWSRGARVGACGDARPRRDRSPRPRCRDARGARGARRRSRHAHGDPCARARRAPRGRGLEAVAAARWILDHFSARVEVAGLDRVPGHGLILLVANHPGLTDAMALIAALDRADLRIVAADYPFLHAMRGLAPRLIFLEVSRGSQLGWIRAVSRDLRQGSVVLLFPAGGLEPDPAVLGAEGALLSWSD